MRPPLALVALAALALAGCTATATGSVTPGASTAPGSSASPGASASPAASASPGAAASPAASPAASASPAAGGSVTASIDGQANAIAANVTTKGSIASTIGWEIGRPAGTVPEGTWFMSLGATNTKPGQPASAAQAADLGNKRIVLNRGTGGAVTFPYGKDGALEVDVLTLAGGKAAWRIKGKFKRSMGTTGPATVTLDATFADLPLGE